MSRELDERVVAMYFDNRNFEKNAQQTIRTLDELKASADMKGVEKGMEMFGQIGEKLNLEKVSKSAQKLKTALSGIGSVVKTAFNAGPIDNMFRAFENFKNNYFNKMLGFDLANKLVSNIENTLRSLTITPITAGYGQYEQSMDSIKTIMSSTGESLDTVKAKLGELTTYANQTIYSLSDMTSNIGKFTNNGVALDKATNAMIGLANATASAGQGAAQASMAMYNVAQAIGVGKMTTIDWKSLENANIATKELKQTFIETAAAAGTLERKVVDGEVQYWTKAEKGSKAMQVTYENFRETLSKDWLTKEAMIGTFGIFSNQLTEAEIAALGFSAEEAARLKKIGEEAQKAATEVRTFHKMMDALKEGVQSTWATSFEYIFGDLVEGTNLWTELNGKIEAVLNRGADERNNILMQWRGMMRDENGALKRIEDVYNARKTMLEREFAEGLITRKQYEIEMLKLEDELGNRALWIDYREMAVGTFMDLFDIIVRVGGAIKSAGTEVFGAFDANALKRITRSIRDFVDGVKAWLDEVDENGTSRIEKIRKAFVGFFSVLKAGYVVFRSVMEVAWKLIQPVIDPLLNLLAKIGDFLNLGSAKTLGDVIKTLAKRFGELWDKIGKLGWSGVLAKMGEWISDLWTKIKEGIAQWLNDNGLGGVVDWFVQLGDSLKEIWDWIKGTWETTGLGPFFRSVWESITNLFKEDDQGEIPIVKFFNSIWTGLQSAWQGIKDTWEQLGISKFFEDIWNSVSGIFKQKAVWHEAEEMVAGGNKKLRITGGYYTYEDAPIVKFFKGIWESLTSTWTSITNWFNDTGITKFFTDVWEWVKGLFTAVDDGEKGKTEAPIVKFFNNIWEGVTSAFAWIQEQWESSGISEFFQGIWDSVTGVFKQKKVWHEAEKGLVKPGQKMWVQDEGHWETVDSPIVSFFKNMYQGLLEIWEKIKTWFTNNVGPIFSDVWTWITTQFKSTTDENGKAQDAPIVKFFKDVLKFLTDAWGDIVGWSGWSAVGKFFTDIWGWITGLFQNDEASTGGANPADSVKQMTEVAKTLTEVNEVSSEIVDEGKTAQKNQSWLEKIGGFFSSIFTSISEAVTSIGADPTFSRALEDITKLVEIIFKTFSDIVDWLHRLVFNTYTNENQGQRALDILYLIFGIVGVVLTKIAEARKLTKLATIAEASSGMNNIGIQILAIAGAIGIIAFAIEKLGAVPLGQLVQGESAVIVVGVIVGILMGLIAKIKQASSLTAKEPEKAWERVVGKLISFAGMAGMLWIVMENIPTLIDALSKAKAAEGVNGDDLLKSFEGILLLVGGAMLALAVVSRIMPNGIDPVATIKTVASVMAAILIAGTVLLGSGALLDLLADAGDIKKSMAMVSEFLEGLGDAINALFRGLIGVSHAEGLQDQQAEKNLERSKDLMGYLSEISGKFDESQLTGISQMMSTITDLTKMAEGVDSSNLVQFSGAMDYLVTGLLRFSELFTGKYHFNESNELEYLEGFAERGSSKWNQIMDAIDMIKQFFGALAEGSVFTQTTPFNVSTWFENLAKGEYVETIITGMNNVIDSAGKLHDGSGIQFDGFAIVKRFYESVADVWNASRDNPDLPKFDGQPLVDAILDSLLVGDYAIKEAIKNMVQDGINLLGQESGSTAFDFSQLMGGLDWSNYFSMPDLTETMSQATGLTDSLVDGIEGKVEGASENISQGLKLKVSGIDLSDSDGDGVPDFIANIQTELDSLQETLDTDDAYALQIRPVFRLDDFGNEVSRLSDFIKNEVPLNMNADMFFGSDGIPIRDANIVDKLEEIRREITYNKESMMSELRLQTTTLGNSIYNLGNDIARMKVWIESKALVGAIVDDMDAALYEKGYAAGMTGVP